MIGLRSAIGSTNKCFNQSHEGIIQSEFVWRSHKIGQVVEVNTRLYFLSSIIHIKQRATHSL